MEAIDFTKVDALETAYTDALRARGEAETAYTQAQNIDTYSAAQALREGKAAPTPKASRKRLDEATQDVEVAREALAQERAEFIADVEARRDDLSVELAAEQDHLQEGALASIKEAEAQLEDRAHARAVQDWLADPSRRVGKRRDGSASQSCTARACARSSSCASASLIEASAPSCK